MLTNTSMVTGNKGSSRSRLPFQTHRLIMAVIAGLVLYAIITKMNWSWLAAYSDQIFKGVWQTLLILISTLATGFLLAIPIGLVQVTGSRPLAVLAHGFCSVIRGTPLLLQVWLLYYGVGAILLQIPGARQTFLWPYLIESWPFAFAALSLSFAGYEGEIMRGAFAGVPKGELEAARAYGMSPFTVLRRIWLPRAVGQVLPTLNGEAILQLKATPLVATITVVETYAVFTKIRQETFITYEPLLLLAFIYLLLAGVITLCFRKLEKQRNQNY